ncbi:hypothetical protein BC937DRAFT_92033 [Endogone sp. FLAS-F59071]|nr:hypothetical protein BC937DRAFT_92033 [Endogone sp. FLAS-F59071]|eukprot:RUS15756.1 hypothetical protein BC937DRAFT_92033 [Endogone sp. FLAS-F59071]
MGDTFSKLRANVSRHRTTVNVNSSNRSSEVATTSILDEFGNPVPEDSKLIDGRAFKKAGSSVYCLPNDKNEYYRLNTQHFLLRNYQSPVTNNLKRGIKELANTFPNSSFIGTDITNNFTSSYPQNVQFVEADTRVGLPFPDNTFDFVYQRANVFCYNEQEWPSVISELVRVCKPGGYVEFLLKLLALRHVSDTAMSDPGMLTAAGLVDVKSIKPQMNLGWGPDKKLGERAKNVSIAHMLFFTLSSWRGEHTFNIISHRVLHPKNYLYIINSTRPLITAALGISDQEYNETFQEIGNELNKGDYQPAHTLYVHYGRKPKEAE